MDSAFLLPVIFLAFLAESSLGATFEEPTQQRLDLFDYTRSFTAILEGPSEASCMFFEREEGQHLFFDAMVRFLHHIN